MQHGGGGVFGIQRREDQRLTRRFIAHTGARGPLPQLGEDSLSVLLEIAQRPGVLDHILALRSLALRGHLRRYHPVGLLVGQAAQGAEPSPAQCDGCVDQDHGIKLRRIEDFE